jgi:hypothetical protein
MSLQQGEDGVRSLNHVPKQAIFRAITPVAKHFGHLRRRGQTTLIGPAQRPNTALVRIAAGADRAA